MKPPKANKYDPHPHPSSFIQDELYARGWTMADLANRMGSESCVSNKLAMDMYFLIGPNDTRMRIGDGTANQLSKAFGISPEYFLNLEAAWLRDADRKARGQDA